MLLATLGATAPPAYAAYVDELYDCDLHCEDRGPVLVVQEGVAGEVNSIQIVESADGIRVTDHASGVRTPAGSAAPCFAEDADTAVCNRGVDFARIALGGADDQLSAAEFTHPLTVEAGTGDDSVLGSATAANLVYGDTGDDALAGGAQDDQIAGGPGRDDLRGGGGEDTADYFAASSGVMVTLGEAGPQGLGAEGDTLEGFEDISGSRFDDVMIGDDGPNRISGGEGSDLIRGLGGPDTLSGDYGVDDVDAGAGRDRVSAASDDARDERGSCGDGFDLSEINWPWRYVRRSTWTTVAADCERATASDEFSVTAHPRLTPRGVWLRAFCTGRSAFCPREYPVALRRIHAPRRLLARGHIRATHRGRWTLIPLRRRGRTLLHAGSTVFVHFDVYYGFATSLR